jgi:hypothetical protein
VAADRCDLLVGHHRRSLRDTKPASSRRDGTIVLYSHIETGRRLREALLEVEPISR